MRPEGKRVAIYARVSSDQQAKAPTIASQVAALRQRFQEDGHMLEEEFCFIDEGCSGGTLVRPSLERLRDMAHAGAIDILYVHSPDRLARKYACQVLLVDELNRSGMKTSFLNREFGQSPEDELPLQVQGVIAEYERAKILERARRGKRYAARRGSLAVMATAPFGYRYIPKSEGGGEAQYQVVLEEARVVRQIFHWVGCEGATLREVCRRLKGIKTRTGRNDWNPSTVAAMLRNPTYQGLAAYGKTRTIERQAQLRPRRLAPGQRHLSLSSCHTARKEQELIAVRALVSKDLFQAVADRLAENERRNRERKTGAKYLLQGLLECAGCRHAYTARQSGKLRPALQKEVYLYYRCSARDKRPAGEDSRCDNESVRIEFLHDAVWRDVCTILRDPDRVKHEYDRRLSSEDPTRTRGLWDAQTALQDVKRGIGRLIDAYENGLLSKEEFEPRIQSRKERLARLEQEAASLAALQEQHQDLRLAIGQLAAFSRPISTRPENADFTAKREIIRALVKRIEIDREDIRVVYRGSPHPFVRGPASGAILHNCRRDQDAFRGTLTLQRRFRQA